ncbi:MAG: hypothetical protein A3D95_09200 [Betaproteobacteria bacterium RIFCSPHIGHO2_12_FULL_69_13]|nr:MAG: hypothetical protein A3D95_09200 [Betaproteobacteria bacterium RIFCSPHIGHO2_12_FULL_69_13]OGA64287.1 MAG: hypothetical protein A3G83_15415 [Betaproteobacteria bacterium RIFCSPLOWO2_12_FULL_68_20]
MPIYEYRCAECGFQDEYLQKVSEPPMSVCPSCGKASFAKLLSAAGFQLKGSGWYATDFRNSGKKPVAKPGESKADAKVEAKSDAKAEAKSDAKAEAKSDAKADAAPASGQGACSACTTD